MKTVASYPRAIFFVSVITSIFSLVLLACVRLPEVSSPNNAKRRNHDIQGGSENPNAGPQMTDGRSQDVTLVDA